MIFIVLGFVIVDGVIFSFRRKIEESNSQLREGITMYREISENNQIYTFLLQDVTILDRNHQQLLDKKQVLIDKEKELMEEVSRLTSEIEQLS